jgi:hypothetical protein
VILAKAFERRFAGFSIGSNNLTQLIFGVGRGSAKLAELFDKQDDAVRLMIQSVITEAHKAHLRADARRFDATFGSEFSRPGLEPPGIPATFSARCVRLNTLSRAPYLYMPGITG